MLLLLGDGDVTVTGDGIGTLIGCVTDGLVVVIEVVGIIVGSVTTTTGGVVTGDDTGVSGGIKVGDDVTIDDGVDIPIGVGSSVVTVPLLGAGIGNGDIVGVSTFCTIVGP